ncbi:hypothetical protein T265_10102 [Opisthorchis viverrini]|uniref:Uncharacterized protein n=1 Tax=Opisthorchis viverrini TaxID=6198 RepID=A0A074Z7Q2_OPIVI|nr:hypothetical protein T265_10102 [Opisthorchis viverrini]KER21607.1 hypothetical protein T265_10102 [Opisthorchis viverrini]
MKRHAKKNRTGKEKFRLRHLDTFPVGPNETCTQQVINHWMDQTKSRASIVRTHGRVCLKFGPGGVASSKAFWWPDLHQKVLPYQNLNDAYLSSNRSSVVLCIDIVSKEPYQRRIHVLKAKNNEQCNRLANLLWKLKAVPTAFDEKPVSRPCVDAELSLNGVDALKAQTTSMERNIENQSVYLDDARGAKTKIPTRSFLVAQVGGFVVGKSEYVDENRIENYLAQSQDRLEANNITFDILTVHPDGLTLKRGDWWPRDEEQKLNINELNRVDYCKSTDNLLVLDYKFPESNKRRICLFAADTPEERKLLVKQIKDLKTQRNMSPCTDSASENQRKNTMSQELSGEDYNVPISREQHSDKIPTSMSKTCRASPDKKRENQKDSPKILKCEKIGREPNGPQDFPKRSIYQFPLDHVDAFSVDAEEILDPQKIEDYLSRKRQVTSGEMVIMEIDSDGIKLDKGLWWSENPRVLKRTQSGIHAIFPLPSDDKLWALAYFTFDLRLKRVHIFRSFSLEDRNKTIATLRNYVNPDISAIINLARELGLRQNGLDGHYVTSCAVKVGQQGGHEKILTANSTGRNKEIVLSPRNTPIKSTPSIHHQMERYDKVDVKDTIDLQFDEEDDESEPVYLMIHLTPSPTSPNVLRISSKPLTTRSTETLSNGRKLEGQYAGRGQRKPASNFSMNTDLNNIEGIERLLQKAEPWSAEYDNLVANAARQHMLQEHD